MTQSVAQKKLIPEKTWRRQTDSPTWWITFCCGSVIFHLLVFWLIGLYELNSSRQGNGSFATIDFIEISSQKSSRAQTQRKPKTKPKSVSKRRVDIAKKQAAKTIVPQNSQFSAKPRSVKPPVSTNDGNVIAFDTNRKIEQLRQQQLAQQQQLQLRQREAEQRLLAEKLRRRVAQQQQLEAQLRQREAQQQRLLAEQLRQREAQQRQLEQRLRQREAQQRQLEERLRQRETQQQRLLEEARLQREEKQRQLEAQRQLEQQQLEARLQREEQQRQLEEARLQREEQQRQLEETERQEQQEKLLQKLRQTKNEQLSQNSGNGEKITEAIANQEGLVTKQPKLNSQTPQSPAKINQNEKIPLNQSGKTQLNQSGGILTASWNIDTTTPITRDIPANPPRPKENISKSFVIPASEANNFQSKNFQVYLNIDEEGKVKPFILDKSLSPQERLIFQEYVDKEFLDKQLFYPATDPDPRTGELKTRRGELFIRIKIQRGY